VALGLIRRYRESHSGSRFSFLSGAVVLVMTAAIFVAIFFLDDRIAWVETGNAVGGIMSVVAVTFGAIALWSTIDSNSVLSERADRVFESKQALEEALALLLKTADICERFRGGRSHLLVSNALQATQVAGWDAMKSGLYRLLLTNDNLSLDNGGKEHIDTMSSLQFLTILQLVDATTEAPQIDQRCVELARMLSKSLDKVTYSQIRRSLRQRISLAENAEKAKSIE